MTATMTVALKRPRPSAHRDLVTHGVKGAAPHDGMLGKYGARLACACACSAAEPASLCVSLLLGKSST